MIPTEALPEFTQNLVLFLHRMITCMHYQQHDFVVGHDVGNYQCRYSGQLWHKCFIGWWSNSFDKHCTISISLSLYCEMLEL